MNKQNRNKLIHTENKWMFARWKGKLGEQVKKGKGIRCKMARNKNSHGDVKYNTGNIVNNIVITVYGVRWVLVLAG